MMEKLGAPQTHLALKAMIKEVDEDGDNKISFREVSWRLEKTKSSKRWEVGALVEASQKLYHSTNQDDLVAG